MTNIIVNLPPGKFCRQLGLCARHTPKTDFLQLEILENHSNIDMKNKTHQNHQRNKHRLIDLLKQGSHERTVVITDVRYRFLGCEYQRKTTRISEHWI